MPVSLCKTDGTSEAKTPNQQAQADIAALLKMPSSATSKRAKAILGIESSPLGRRVKSLLGRVDRFLFPKDFSTAEKVLAVAGVILAVGALIALASTAPYVLIGFGSAALALGIGYASLHAYCKIRNREFHEIMGAADEINRK